MCQSIARSNLGAGVSSFSLHINSHAVTLVNGDSLWTSSTKMRNIEMGFIFENMQSCCCLLQREGRGIFLLDSLRRTQTSQIHLYFGKSNIQPTNLISEEPSAHFSHLTLNMEYIDSSFV